MGRPLSWILDHGEFLDSAQDKLKNPVSGQFRMVIRAFENPVYDTMCFRRETEDLIWFALIQVDMK